MNNLLWGSQLKMIVAFKKVPTLYFILLNFIKYKYGFETAALYFTEDLIMKYIST